ncbi:DUF4173 domain-containing protein [Nocardia sp. NBC_01377]|uniref:DUF4153 domain-containing protein n=1 Tax=Nocardia sp. NBC_01377 TaxID=2903595 RepID=UPI0032569372
MTDHGDQTDERAADTAEPTSDSTAHTTVDDAAAKSSDDHRAVTTTTVQRAAPKSEPSAPEPETEKRSTVTDADHTPIPPPGPMPSVTPVSVPSGPAPAGWPTAPGGSAPYEHVPRWRRVVCPPGVLPAAVVSGTVAAAAIPLDRPGLGWLLAAAVTAVVIFEVDRRARRSAEPNLSVPAARAAEVPSTSTVSGSAAAVAVIDSEAAQDNRSVSPLARVVRNRERIWWTAIGLGLLSVGTFRAAGWLFVLCAIAASVAGSLAVIGRRTARGTWHDVVAVPLATISAAVPWAYARAEGIRGNGPSVRTSWSILVTGALLAVLVPLLGSADATFGALVGDVVPEIGTGTVLRWISLFVVVGAGSLGAMYLLAGPPPTAVDTAPERGLRRQEWALPMGALTVLFALFVAVQFVALFGGDDYVQRTSGLTYSEYARTGFWQLSIVSVLTLAVIMVVLHLAGRDNATDRAWLRTLTGAVSTLSLVIVASALARMWTYQQAYGFTVLRLLVEVFELWLGLIFVLILAALPRLDLTWLPRAALGTAFATLLALALIDPERLIADRNIDRWEHGESLDTEYLTTLSPDILPALTRLPAPMGTPIQSSIRADIPDDSWSSWNRSRARTR